jgi:hypothetical protein
LSKRLSEGNIRTISSSLIIILNNTKNKIMY